MGIKGRIAKIYANGNMAHHVLKLFGFDDWNEHDHPRDKDGKFTSGGGGSSGEKEKPVDFTSASAPASQKLKEQPSNYSDLIFALMSGEKKPEDIKTDPDFDIFNWEEEEETEQEKKEREEREKEEKQKKDFGQHGLSEKEYPAELRLTKEERDIVNDILHGYRDPNHKINASADVMEAVKGNGIVTKERLDEKEKELKEIIEASTEEIDRKKADGYSYKTHNPQSMETRKQKMARWWNEVMATGTPQSNWGERGIRYWQLLRAESKRQLEQIGFAKKLVARAEYAEKQPGYLPWRKNENVSNPHYRPWTAQDGGPGSGNHDHAGRPGEVGGSAPSGQGSYGRAVREAAKKSRDYVDFWMNLPESEQKKFTSKESLKSAFEELKNSTKEEHQESEEPEWKPTNGTRADMPKKAKVPEKLPEIKVVNNPDDTATAHAGKMGEIEINLANFDPENIDSVISHEAAHQLSNNDPELQQAIIMNYGDVLGRYNKKKQHFDGIFGEYNPEEAFATGFSNYLNYPKQMQEKYPEAYQFFDDLAKNQPETVEYIKNTVQEAKQAVNHQGGNTEYLKKLQKEREDVLSLPQNKQAQFAYKAGIANRKTCVEAMKNGTASELVNKYFDILEENGDPTPTKEARVSPDINEEVRNGKFSGHDEARLHYIKEWTGMDDTEAKETLGELKTWFSGRWVNADTKAVDKYIDSDGVYDGDIYRGLHFSIDEYDKFMEGIQQGGTLRMMGMNSSWTTSREDAWNFSGGRDRRVLIRCAKNKTSAPVSHLSSQGESEVLAHSKTQWTILNVSEGVDATVITVVESESRMSDDERSQLREKNGMRALDSDQDEEGLEGRMNGQQKYFTANPPSEELKKKLESEDYADDGGPGSGNFGHKGRPGKRGGSGPGGGKQYRGGRSDIGYYGSRKDWLNGLTGERQHEAARFVASAKKEKNARMEAKNKIESMWKRGMLTQAEAEQRIKDANLDKLYEETSPEEFVLRFGDKAMRENMLKMVKEARSWDDRKDRMIKENLSEDEQKILNAMQDDNWADKFDDADIKTAKEANKIHDFLEAKAMGLVDSDIEIPDEVQYALGTKERPAPPEPEKPERPELDWYNNPQYMDATSETERLMSDIIGEPYTGNWTKDEFAEKNQRFVDEIQHGQQSTKQLENGVRSIFKLRTCMTRAIQGEFFYTPEMISRLSDDEQKRMLNIVNSLYNKNRFVYHTFNSLEEVPTHAYENVELHLRLSKPRSNADKQLRKDYILLQEKMLLGAEPRNDEEYAAAKSSLATEKNKEHQEKVKKWHSEHSDAEIARMYHPDSVAGVSRNSAGDMTHDEANEGRVNPHRDTMSPSERGNCQTCVIAYAMRRRGYDVEAKPRKGDAETEQKAVARDSDIAWLDPDTGESPKYTELEKGKKYSAINGQKWLEQNIKEGEIHTFEFCWRHGSGAHIIIAERINGELVLYDPQSSTSKKATYKGSEITEYLRGIHWNSEANGNWRPKLLRVDNALPNPKYCDRILKKAGT